MRCRPRRSVFTFANPMFSRTHVLPPSVVANTPEVGADVERVGLRRMNDQRTSGRPRRGALRIYGSCSLQGAFRQAGTPSRVGHDAGGEGAHLRGLCA